MGIELYGYTLDPTSLLLGFALGAAFVLICVWRDY